MNPSKGYYSLIQYCPDLSRLEAANVGVVLFCPEQQFIRARVARSNQRIRKFFGSEERDWDQLNALKTAVEERLEVEAERFRTLEVLQDFINTRGNEIQLTPPRPVKVFNPEQDLELLFERLVGGQAQPRGAAPVAQRLDETFSQQDILPFIRRNVPVTVRAFHQQRTVPYGYRNGRFNLIQPATFQSQPINRACRYAVEGRSLFDHPDEVIGEMQLVVVGEFAPDHGDAREVVEGILEQNKVRLFTITELPRLLDEIRSTGKILA